LNCPILDPKRDSRPVPNPRLLAVRRAPIAFRSNLDETNVTGSGTAGTGIVGGLATPLNSRELIWKEPMRLLRTRRAIFQRAQHELLPQAEPDRGCGHHRDGGRDDPKGLVRRPLMSAKGDLLKGA
jgi:hypothetical protein